MSAFCLLYNLPTEIFRRVIFPLLDGRALSTLFVALSSERDNKDDNSAKELRRALLHYGNDDRLESLCRTWQSQLDILVLLAAGTASNTTNNNDGMPNSNQQNEMAIFLEQIRPYIFRAIHCIREFQQEQQYNNDNGKETNVSRQNQGFSETMILSDTFHFPYHSIGRRRPLPTTTHNNQLATIRPVQVELPEWPIWCGQIKVLLWVPRGSFHGMQRIVMNANVILLSPHWDEKHYIAWDSLGGNHNNDDNNDDHHDDHAHDTGSTTPRLSSIQLVADSYNFLPTPPMGRMVGLQDEDRRTLRALAARLSDQNTVAILPPQGQSRQSRYIQNLRIISRRQARARIKNMPRLPFSYYVQNINAPQPEQEISQDASAEELDASEDNDLLCCWQYRDFWQDAVFMTASDCVPYWKKLVQTRQQFLPR